MNPAKRKKLYRLKLQNKNLETSEKVLVPEVEEKVVQKEEVVTQPVVISEVIAETATAISSVTEMGLKLPELDSLEVKKEKKKKYSSQDS